MLLSLLQFLWVPPALALGTRLRVVVLAFNRPDELSLTLSNLNMAYFASETPLRIVVDGPRSGSPDDTDRVKATAEVARRFQWKHGTATIDQAPVNRGILGQWLAGWEDPEDSGSVEEYCLFIEDDVEIARSAPVLLQKLISKLKERALEPEVYGIALQRPQWVLGGAPDRNRWRRLDLNLAQRDRHPLYKYVAVGTWGQLMFPKAWAAFLDHHNKATGTAEPVEGLLTDYWQTTRIERRLFSPIFTRFALARGLYNVYCMARSNTTFALSRQPPGVNSNGQHRGAEGSLQLASEDDTVRFLEDVAAMNPASPAIKNHCWDTVEWGALAQYQRKHFGVIFKAAQPMENMLASKCCLEGRWRIHMLPVHEAHEGCAVFRQAPLLRGCWKVDPVGFVRAFLNGTSNVRFDHEASGHHLGILRVPGSEGWRRVKISNDVFGMETANRLTDGCCAALKCPFAPGQYPDGYASPA